ncbi:FecR family protein, partial [Dawidia soli]
TEERILILHGEAYFNVAHDSLHQFSVRLDDIFVTALGTTFSIRANDGEESITIRVLRGRVSVHTDQYELAQLGDNEKMTLYRNDMHNLYEGYPVWDFTLPFKWKTEKLPVGVDWKSKTKLAFENARFNDIIRRVEQHFGVVINLKDKSLGDIRVTATFSNDISLNSILRDLSLVSSCEINLVQSDPLTIEFQRQRSLSLPRRVKIVP